MSYTRELMIKQKHLKGKIKEKEMELERVKKMSIEFINEYTELNNLRVKLRAVNERIKFHNNPAWMPPTYTILNK